MTKLGEQPKSLLDVLAYAEKMQWLDSAEEFIGSRKLRNQLVHEYMPSSELFLEELLAANEASSLLLESHHLIGGPRCGCLSFGFAGKR